MDLSILTDTRADNGWKHGLYARRVLVRAEEQRGFETLRDALVEEWKPRNVTSWLLVDQLARLHWRLLRAGEAEVDRLDRLMAQPGSGGDGGGGGSATRSSGSAGGSDRCGDRGGGAGGSVATSPEAALAYDVGRQGSSLQRIQLYQMRLERAAHRCIALLIALRKSRGKRGNLRARRPAEITA